MLPAGMDHTTERRREDAVSLGQVIFVIVMIVVVIFLYAPFVLSGRISEEERRERGED